MSPSAVAECSKKFCAHDWSAPLLRFREILLQSIRMTANSPASFEFELAEEIFETENSRACRLLQDAEFVAHLPNSTPTSLISHKKFLLRQRRTIRHFCIRCKKAFGSYAKLRLHNVSAHTRKNNRRWLPFLIVEAVGKSYMEKFFAKDAWQRKHAVAALKAGRRNARVKRLHDEEVALRERYLRFGVLGSPSNAEQIVDPSKVDDEAKPVFLYHTKTAGSAPKGIYWICPECPHARPSIFDVEKHMLLHTKNIGFNCTLCSFSAGNAANLAIHIANHNAELELLKTQNNLSKLPVKLKNGPMIGFRMGAGFRHVYMCRLCPYKASTYGKLCSHVRRHNNTKRGYNCNSCEFQTLLKSRMELHYVVHKAQTIKAQVFLKPKLKALGEKFGSSPSSMGSVPQRLGDTLGPGKTYKCSNCKFASDSYQQVYRHKNVTHAVATQVVPIPIVNKNEATEMAVSPTEINNNRKRSTRSATKYTAETLESAEGAGNGVVDGVPQAKRRPSNGVAVLAQAKRSVSPDDGEPMPTKGVALMRARKEFASTLMTPVTRLFIRQQSSAVQPVQQKLAIAPMPLLKAICPSPTSTPENTTADMLADMYSKELKELERNVHVVQPKVERQGMWSSLAKLVTQKSVDEAVKPTPKSTSPCLVDCNEGQKIARQERLASEAENMKLTNEAERKAMMFAQALGERTAKEQEMAKTSNSSTSSCSDSDKNGSFKCRDERCPASFTTRIAMLDHLLMHNNNSPLHCRECTYRGAPGKRVEVAKKRLSARQKRSTGGRCKLEEPYDEQPTVDDFRTPPNVSYQCTTFNCKFTCATFDEFMKHRSVVHVQTNSMLKKLLLERHRLANGNKGGKLGTSAVQHSMGAVSSKRNCDESDGNTTDSDLQPPILESQMDEPEQNPPLLRKIEGESSAEQKVKLVLKQGTRLVVLKSLGSIRRDVKPTVRPIVPVNRPQYTTYASKILTRSSCSAENVISPNETTTTTPTTTPSMTSSRWAKPPLLPKFEPLLSEQVQEGGDPAPLPSPTEQSPMFVQSPTQLLAAKNFSIDSILTSSTTSVNDAPTVTARSDSAALNNPALHFALSGGQFVPSPLSHALQQQLANGPPYPTNVFPSMSFPSPQEMFASWMERLERFNFLGGRPPGDLPPC